MPFDNFARNQVIAKALECAAIDEETRHSVARAIYTGLNLQEARLFIYDSNQAARERMTKRIQEIVSTALSDLTGHEPEVRDPDIPASVWAKYEDSDGIMSNQFSFYGRTYPDPGFIESQLRAHTNCGINTHVSVDAILAGGKLISETNGMRAKRLVPAYCNVKDLTGEKSENPSSFEYKLTVTFLTQEDKAKLHRA